MNCSKCGKEIDEADGDSAWPADGDNVQCLLCWESECAESWYEYTQDEKLLTVEVNV